MKGFLKLLKKNLSTCPKCTGGNISTQNFKIDSTAEPGLLFVLFPHKMSICTLAFLWAWLLWTKRKSLLYNSEIYWEWNTLTLGVESIATCASKAKQCMKLRPSTSPAYKKAKEIFVFAKEEKKKKTKWTPLCHGNLCLKVLGFLSWSRHVCTSMMKQLLQKFSDMLQPLWHKYSTLRTASF